MIITSFSFEQNILWIRESRIIFQRIRNSLAIEISRYVRSKNFQIAKLFKMWSYLGCQFLPDLCPSCGVRVPEAIYEAHCRLSLELKDFTFGQTNQTGSESRVTLFSSLDAFLCSQFNSSNSLVHSLYSEISVIACLNF